MDSGHMVFSLVIFLCWPCGGVSVTRPGEGVSVARDLRIKRQTQFNTVPTLPSGPGSARSLFDQIVKKINQGHQRAGDGPKLMPHVTAPLQNIGIPQSHQPQVNQLDASFNNIPTQPFTTLNTMPNIRNQVQPSQVPIQPPKAILPHFTPELKQESQSSTPIQNLGLALFNKNLETGREIQLREQETIFDALDAQLQEENIMRLQEQRHLENFAIKQKQQEIEAIRQEELVRIQEERVLQEKAFQEQLRQKSFSIQQQRELEERVNNERLRMIEEERQMELEELKRQKDFFRLENKRIGLKQHLQERSRFSAHKAIANTFISDKPVKQNAFRRTVIGK